MLSAHDNETLTRTNAGTAMGELLRRFWMPVLLAKELPGPDCDPVRVGVCGEEFVAFRDTQGRIGLLDARCPHRGAELFWGRNEECGLRCVYHGWKFDAEGTCVDLPSEPQDSNFREKIRTGAYPTREYGGLIWAYFGPPELVPPLPHLEFGHVPPENLFVSKKLQECNWAQSVEGAIDTAHFSFLHMPKDVDDSMPQIVRWMKNDGAPRFTVLEHDAGLLIGGARTTDSDDLYWRLTQFLVPNHSLAPGSMGQDNMNGQTWVPIDDHTCWVYCYTWNPWRPLTERERGAMQRGAGIHSEVDAKWRPVRNRDNDYLIDRQAQRTTSFSGVRGISEQDAYIQDSQGTIYDRTREHLGTTDIAIIEWRKLMLRLARDLREGEEPPQARRPEAYWVRSGGAIASASVPFEEVAGPRVRIE
jgi:phenylpropionate dioxygenase-like ring-hydroxylating dioxygenase large terminal subunit